MNGMNGSSGAASVLEALVARGVLAPPQARHVQHLRARAREGWSEARLVVDLGYCDRNVVAECVVALRGGRRWDGRAPDAEAIRRTADARPLEGRVLALVDGVVVWASVDPEAGADGETFRLASGARAARHEIVTGVDLETLDDCIEPNRFEKLAAEADVARLVGRALGGMCVERGRAVRFRAGDTAELAWGPDLTRTVRLASEVAAAAVDRLRELAGVEPRTAWGAGMMGLRLGPGRVADVELRFAPTTRGLVGVARFAPSPLAHRREDQPGSPALGAAHQRVSAAKGRAALDAALDELVTVSAAEPSSDGSSVHDHLLALERRVEFLRWAQRSHDAGALAARATALCIEHAPAAAELFESAMIAARPQGTRAPLLRARATTIAAHDPLSAVDALVDALADLDPALHAGDVATMAAELAALELRMLGAPSLGTLEGTRRLALARAATGDRDAEASVEEVAVLARALQGEGADGTIAYVRGTVRLAQGRPAEAETEFRAAIAAWAKVGWNAPRWTAALELARSWVALGRLAEAREMVAAARASGALDEDGVADAELVLREAAGPGQPYR